MAVSVRVTGRRNGMLALALWRRDHGMCWRCGGYIDPTISRMLPGGLTIGHIIPLSRGGSGEPGRNLAPEHRRCNLEAGNRDARPIASIVTPRW